MALTKCKECGVKVSKKAKKCPSCGAPIGPKQYSLGVIIVLVLFSWFMYSIFTTDRISINDHTYFQQIGYLKDDVKNRVFTISYKKSVPEHVIKAHAESLKYTSGQMMAAYFYPEGSLIPADGVTLASSLFQANDVLYDTPGLSKWRYAYMRHFKGTSEFVDCDKNMGSDLCRKK